ncbi:MAG: dihydrofolate reductase family protein [Bacteroidales bacterium]|jgi:dihydrofolate reductase|nr:dihydrofolate reductase family protein [Bacteroidales bacterium]
MDKRNIVYIAQSIDGYIADKNGGLDWLQTVPNPDNSDMGYNSFIKQIDAIIMGRNTFETVCSFDCEWPYTLPVFVLSNSLKSIADSHKYKAELVNGSLKDILKKLNNRGLNQIYIDGGKTVQNFLKEDLVDDLIITTIPVILGGGYPLFAELPKTIEFELIKSELFLNQIVQNHYRRKV